MPHGPICVCLPHREGATRAAQTCSAAITVRVRYALFSRGSFDGARPGVGFASLRAVLRSGVGIATVAESLIYVRGATAQA